MKNKKNKYNPKIKKLDLNSMSITEEQKRKLKQLFPEVFNEKKIDWDKLKATLGEELDNGQERYHTVWPGKSDCFRIIQQSSFGTLKPRKKESVDWGKTNNLFIEGDNLEVLKLLQRSYYNKVKMIYIDPPYNTGKDFIYPDNYSETLDTYLQYTDQKDSEGNKFSTNQETDGRFHSKWMNMMYPRLFLARNLLREDGVIFISIDDNEVTNLRKICDEIFGEENFIDTICWKKKYGGGAKERYLVSVHEYILMFAKDKMSLPEIFIKFEEEKARRFYKYKDENFNRLGYYRMHPLEAVKSFDIRENLKFPIIAPDGQKVYPNRQWRWSQERFKKALQKNEVIFQKNKSDKWVLYSKQYINEESGERRKTKAQSVIDDIFTQEGTKEIFNVFSDAKVFLFPKPVNLLKQLIEIGGLSKGDIVLDFFAGSGTTAHAVYEKNLEDGGNRKYICVQLPEPTQKDSEAYKAGFQTISDIGKERIRRVIKKIKEENKQQSLLDHNINNLDLGFKVFKLDKSNFKVWKEEIGDQNPSTQIKMHLDEFIDQKSSKEDLLYEILLKTGYPLTTEVKPLKLNDKKIYSIDNNALLICLEQKITKTLIKEMAKLKPARVVCIDIGFENNDQLKTNAKETFNSFGVRDFKVI